MMLVELVEPPGLIITHRFFTIPSAVNLGSLSWYIDAHAPGRRPTVPELLAVGNRLFSAVSMRALFQMCSLQAPPGCVAWLPNAPALAMYSPKNEPSPGVAATYPEGLPSGRRETPLAREPAVMYLPGPGRPRNTRSTLWFAPGALTTMVSPVMVGRVTNPVTPARFRLVRTCAAVVSKPVGISDAFALTGKASAMTCQIGIEISGAWAPSHSMSERLSKYVPTLSPVVGEQVASVMALNV